jgi:hypothetical protein
MPDRPPCKPFPRPEPNIRLAPTQLCLPHQPLGNPPVLNSTKPLEIARITNLNNCRISVGPVNPDTSSPLGFAPRVDRAVCGMREF